MFNIIDVEKMSPIRKNHYKYRWQWKLYHYQHQETEDEHTIQRWKDGSLNGYEYLQSYKYIKIYHIYTIALYICSCIFLYVYMHICMFMCVINFGKVMCGYG